MSFNENDKLLCRYNFETSDISGGNLKNLATNTLDAYFVNGSYNDDLSIDYTVNIQNAVVDTQYYRSGTASLPLDHSNQKTYVLRNAPLSIDNSGLTVCFWCLNAQADSTVFLNGDYSSLFSFFEVKGNKIEVTSSDKQLTSSLDIDLVNPSIDKWIHVAISMTYAATDSNTSTWTVYINGIEHATTTEGYYPQNTSGSCKIGNGDTYTSVTYPWNLDDFRVYNKVIGTSDIGTIINNTTYLITSVPSGNTDKMLCRYEFETTDISGGNLKNLATNTSDAYFVNGSYNDIINRYIPVRNDYAVVDAQYYKSGTASLPLDRSDQKTYVLRDVPFYTDNSGISVCFWCFNVQADSTVFLNGDHSSGFSYFQVKGNQIEVTSLYKQNTSLLNIDLVNPSINKWIHVAITMSYAATDSNTSTWTVYINGIQITTTQGYYPQKTIGSCKIGNTDMSPGTTKPWNLDDFRVYNKELSPSEISAISTPIVLSENLYFRYEFDTLNNGNLTNSVTGTADAYMAKGIYNSGSYNITLDTTATLDTTNTKSGSGSILFNSTGTSNKKYVVRNNQIVFDTSGVSFSFWCYNAKSNSTILLNGKNSTTQGQPFMELKGGRITVSNSDRTQQISSQPNLYSLSVNTWSHVMITMTYAPADKNTSTWNIYVNGINIQTVNNGYYPSKTTDLCKIGNTDYLESDTVTNWNLDDFRMYNRHFTSDEVKTKFNENIVLTNSLRFQYEFDKQLNGYLFNSATNVYDSYYVDKTKETININGTNDYVTYRSGSGSMFVDGSGNNYIVRKNPLLFDGDGVSFSFWCYNLQSESIVFQYSTELFGTFTTTGTNVLLKGSGFTVTNSTRTQTSTKALSSDFDATFQNKWAHVVVTLNYSGKDARSSRCIIYINKVPTTLNLNNFYYPYFISSNFEKLRLGRGNTYYPWYLDDFRMYNKVLDGTETGALYDATPLPEIPNTDGDLLCRYNFDTQDVSGNSLLNSATNTYDVYFQNGTTLDNTHKYSGTGSLLLDGSGTTIKKFVSSPTFLNFGTTGISILFWCWNIHENAIVFSNSNIFTITGKQIIINTGAQIINTQISLLDNPIDTWTHIAITMTYSNTQTSTLNIYKNGALIKSLNNCYFPIDYIRNGYSIGDANIYEKKIRKSWNLDDFRIYKKVLNRIEISQINNLPFVSDPPPNPDTYLNNPTDRMQCHYKFDILNNNGYLFNSAIQSLDAYFVNSNNIPYIPIYNQGTTVDITTKKYGVGSLRLTNSGKIIRPPLVIDTNGISFGFWCYNMTSETTLFTNGSIDSGRPYFELKGGNIKVTNSDNSNTMELAFNAQYGANTWTHIALTMSYADSDSTTSIWTVYKDGSVIQMGNGYYPTYLSGTQDICVIGTSNSTIATTWNLDNFQVYNRKLEATDIQQSMLDTPFNENENLLCRFEFDAQDSQSIINPDTQQSYATIINGASVDTTQKISSAGSLQLDGYSYVMPIELFTFDNSGLSFSFWCYNLPADSAVFVFYDVDDNIRFEMRGNQITVSNVAQTDYTTINNIDISSPSQNNWAFITLTMTYATDNSPTSIWTLYINGLYVTRITDGYYPQNNDLYFDIGRNMDTTLPISAWNLDDFRIYNRVLNDSDVLTMNNALNNTITNIPPENITNGTPENNIICFREGTKIACLIHGKESYVPIETLKRGDLIKTLCHGYKPIQLIGHKTLQNPGNDERTKNRLYRVSPMQYPSLFESLYITGCHGILVNHVTEKQKQQSIELFGDTFITDNKHRLFACIDEKSIPYNKEETCEIYHLALESEDEKINYGIYANGLLVESCPIYNMVKKHNLILF